MKQYRRIEITAFRRRITSVSGSAPADSAEVRINYADSDETVEADSLEGQKALIEAVRLLEERVSDPPSAKS